ncbi:hypothetical protein DH2020_018363 [Rehmannia glutinosa]|uniref:Uncharacterized protein n=1 Tax=Rehmannia glutinosa TaxID=99300 RepID=A0ABR0WLG2_REHGL
MSHNQNKTPGDLVPKHFGSNLTRHDFPDDFLFGAAVSSYQVEGGYDQGRRGMSNWDAWSLLRPGRCGIDEKTRDRYLQAFNFMVKNIARHDYAQYAELCFFEFGDRVKFWITINELCTYTSAGYISGGFPPGHGSPAGELGLTDTVRYRSAPGVDQTCFGGNPATDPYKVAHHLILAYATAVDIYRRKYQAIQGGKIGTTNAINWYIPYSELPEDIAATKRAIAFVLGWFIEPLVSGEYPKVMRKRVEDRLPKFKPEEEKLAGSEWLYIVPVGIYELLVYAKEKYNDPVIYITENGVDEKNHKHLPLSILLDDDYRIKYHQEHLAYVKLAME